MGARPPPAAFTTSAWCVQGRSMVRILNRPGRGNRMGLYRTPPIHPPYWRPSPLLPVVLPAFSGKSRRNYGQLTVFAGFCGFFRPGPASLGLSPAVPAHLAMLSGGQRDPSVICPIFSGAVLRRKSDLLRGPPVLYVPARLTREVPPVHLSGRAQLCTGFPIHPKL